MCCTTNESREQKSKKKSAKNEFFFCSRFSKSGPRGLLPFLRLHPEFQVNEDESSEYFSLKLEFLGFRK
jgi:hypothetical protein